ncbi:TorF family putative porin [Emcibacter sp. SYSU 3D8]|uniref:TorF family putative porin n=1 Tax=Emcibacter sp. SYSU 3D8 TaxID=3133969 RepID=UPI0031FE4691
MMKFTKAIALAALAAGIITTSGPAMAETAAEPDFSFSGNIAITNDYVFRGFTQTNEDFAVQGGFDLAHKSGLAVGVWASNIEFLDETGGNSTSVEVDLYASYSGTFGNSIFGYEVGAIYYMYPGDPSGSDYAYWEFWGKVSADFGFASVGTGIVYSPDFFGGAGDMINVPLDVSVPIPLGSDRFGLSVSGQLGYNEYTNAGVTWDGVHDSYLNWNIGLTLSITDWFDVDVRYHDTDLDNVYCHKLCDERVTVMVSRSI